jgi:phage recombination protein Bet
MSTDLLTKPAPTDLVSQETVVAYMDAMGLGTGLMPGEKTQFIEVARAFQLNPFKREIYCIAYGQGDKRKLSILTGFEVYLKRAERTNLLDGWKVWTEGKIESRMETREFNKKDGGTYKKQVKVWSGDLKAIIEIYRKDRSRPFVHEVAFTEYSQDNEMWAGKPMTMIKKVAISQGFRLCFPDELGGLPYTPDELPDEMTTMRTVSGEETKKTAETTAPATETKTAAETSTTEPDPRLEWDQRKLMKSFAEFQIPFDEKGEPVADWVFTAEDLAQLGQMIRQCASKAELIQLYDQTKEIMKAKKLAQLNATPDAKAAEDAAAELFDEPEGESHE